MAIFRNLKNKGVRVGKRLFGYNEIKGGYDTTKTLLKDVIKSTQKQDAEPTPVSLDDATWKKREQAYKNIFLLFALIFIMGLFYFIASLIHRNFSLSLMIIGFEAFCLALTFRYHFWWYQTKQRTLGLSFKQWYMGNFKQKSKNKV